MRFHFFLPNLSEPSTSSLVCPSFPSLSLSVFANQSSPKGVLRSFLETCRVSLFFIYMLVFQYTIQTFNPCSYELEELTILTSITAPFPSWPPETGTFPLAFALDQPTTGNEPWCPHGGKGVHVWTFSCCDDPSDPCSAVSPGLVCLSMALGNIYGGPKRDQLWRNMIEKWLGKKAKLKVSEIQLSKVFCFRSCVIRTTLTLCSLMHSSVFVQISSNRSGC